MKLGLRFFLSCTSPWIWVPRLHALISFIRVSVTNLNPILFILFYCSRLLLFVALLHLFFQVQRFANLGWACQGMCCTASPLIPNLSASPLFWVILPRWFSLNGEFASIVTIGLNLRSHFFFPLLLLSPSIIAPFDFLFGSRTGFNTPAGRCS